MSTVSIHKSLGHLFLQSESSDHKSCQIFDTEVNEDKGGVNLRAIDVDRVKVSLNLFRLRYDCIHLLDVSIGGRDVARGHFRALRLLLAADG